jgi:hypothetical protein
MCYFEDAICNLKTEHLFHGFNSLKITLTFLFFSAKARTGVKFIFDNKIAFKKSGHF